MRKGVITYGLQRVGQELSDDAAASASQAIDQRVWHIFSSLLLFLCLIPSLPPFSFSLSISVSVRHDRGEQKWINLLFNSLNARAKEKK